MMVSFYLFITKINGEMVIQCGGFVHLRELQSSGPDRQIKRV